jgi:predicted MFS family arabinose efflux permease
LEKLSGKRLRKAQIAMLITFTFTGHIALSSVAWVPEFIDRLGVSFATWGTIIGFGVVGSITPLFFVSRLIMRFGPRTLIRLGNYFGAVFLVLLSVTTNPAIWFFINMGFNFFMSILGVSVNAHSVLLQKQISKNVIGRFHAGWSLGAVGAAITGGLSTVFMDLQQFLILVAILNVIVFEFALRWLLSPTEDGHLEERAAVVKRKFYQLPAQLVLLAVGMIGIVYPEVAVIDWAAVFARDVLNVDLALRSLPFAAFMVGMIVGRLSMTRLAEKYHPNLIASRGAFLAAVVLALVAISAPLLAESSSTLALGVTMLLWLIAGLGLAPGAPTFMSAAGHVPGVSTAWAVSRLSLMSSTMSVMAKTLMGALAEGVGLSLAFFFPVTLAVISGLIAHQFAQKAKQADLDSVAPPTSPMPIIVIEESR